MRVAPAPVNAPRSWPNSSLSSSSVGSAAQFTLTKGLVAAARSAMEFARDHFLADAAFTAQEHGHVAVGDAIHHRQDGFHRRARTPAGLRAFGILGDLRAEPRDLGRERLALERVANRRLERGLTDAIGIAGLQHVVAAPRRTASTIVAGVWRPESMMTCAAGCACRIARKVSMPSRSGISTSSRIRFGAAPASSCSMSAAPVWNTSTA